MKIITQNDIELLMQSSKRLFYKLELLNEHLQVIETIQGNLISDNISIDSESDIRRTYTCELIVTDSSFMIGRDKKIWFNKRIRPHIGIMNYRTQQIEYYLLGTFVFTDTNFNYDEITNKLSLTCNDCMALLNDNRNGQLDAYTRTVLVDSDARSVIISILEEVGIERYYIEFNINNQTMSTFSVPHDLIYSAGTSAYNIIKELIDLYAGTQMYFDIDGTFIIKRIPTGFNEQNIITDDILQPILINEQMTNSFSQIYNHIIIYGKLNEPDYYSQDVSLVYNTYNVNIVLEQLDTNNDIIVDYDAYGNHDVFALRIPSANLETCYININSLGAIPVVNELGENIPQGTLLPNTDYIFRYRQDIDSVGSFLFIGEYQCVGEAIDTTSDVSVSNIGERLKVLTGGDYDIIPSSDLCNQRANWELYNSIKFHETLTISIIAIPWLDVNDKIQYTSKITNTTNEYLITNITCNYAEQVMNINLIKYYPNFI